MINRFKKNNIKIKNKNTILQGLAKDILGIMSEQQIKEILNNENAREIVSRYKVLKPVCGYKIKNPDMQFFKTKEEYQEYAKNNTIKLF